MMVFLILILHFYDDNFVVHLFANGLCYYCQFLVRQLPPKLENSRLNGSYFAFCDLMGGFGMIHDYHRGHYCCIIVNGDLTITLNTKYSFNYYFKYLLAMAVCCIHMLYSNDLVHYCFDFRSY